MPASLDCVLCLTRQSLEAARFATDDEKKHAAVLKKAYQYVLDHGFTMIPPLVAQGIQRIIREETGNPDPYSEQKIRFNALMISVRDSLRDRIRTSPDPLKTAIRLAIAGNTIDYAVRGDWSEPLVLEAMEAALSQEINGDPERLIKEIGAARSLFYLADNCGEIVCDQLLIEEIRRFRPELPLTLGIRGAAVLNDVTWSDVRQVGLEGTVPIVDNGNDAVGTVLEQCGPKFMESFRNSDLVLAKGLANFETLIEYAPEELPPTVCFLFKAKCPFIARFADVRLGDPVIRIQKR